MADRKNAFDRFFSVLRLKKESAPDITRQADKVIEDYIFTKNRLIHKKCSSERKSDRLVAFTVTASAVTALILIAKLIW